MIETICESFDHPEDVGNLAAHPLFDEHDIGRLANDIQLDTTVGVDEKALIDVLLSVLSKLPRTI